MRNDKKITKTAEINRVQGYHQGGYGSEQYAFMGFKSNKYFTSDRFINLDAGFIRPDGKPLKGFGLEIESECDGIVNQTVLAEVLHKVIFSHFPADLFKLQNDGSLGGRTSAECITQVMTKEFIRNNYANFKLMYDTYFPAFNITCGRESCGMHVNLSNALFGAKADSQELAIRKLFYIVNKHFDFCCEMFRRSRNRTTYCDRCNATMEYAKTTPINRMPADHYHAMNMGHFNAGRIELRLVGGQKNYASFRNTMECVFHLVDSVKKLSWTDCDDLTKIFSGCNQYVYDRIKSYCKDGGTITADQCEKIRATVKRDDFI